MADWDQIEGEAKEKAGEVTGDEDLEAEGKAQGAWGDTKEAAEDMKEAAEVKWGSDED
jgi:uncharacterized protein YjbJ (UPF0337 family)